MEVLPCSSCGEVLSVSRFGRRDTKRGYHSVCRECSRKRTRDYRKRNPEAGLWSACKNRARIFEVPFEISKEDINIPEHCPVLGIKLTSVGAGGREATTPSVDRVIPELGYVKGNIQVISWRANRLKSDATLGEVESMYRYMTSQSASK